MIRLLKPASRAALVLMAGLALSNATQPISTYAVVSTAPVAPAPQVAMCGVGAGFGGALIAAVLGTLACGPGGALVLGVVGALTAGAVQAGKCGVGLTVTRAPNQYPATVLDK